MHGLHRATPRWCLHVPRVDSPLESPPSRRIAVSPLPLLSLPLDGETRTLVAFACGVARPRRRDVRWRCPRRWLRGGDPDARRPRTTPKRRICERFAFRFSGFFEPGLCCFRWSECRGSVVLDVSAACWTAARPLNMEDRSESLPPRLAPSASCSRISSNLVTCDGVEVLGGPRIGDPPAAFPATIHL
jgi:hypothetical protein